jgi:hypothetical protein
MDLAHGKDGETRRAYGISEERMILKQRIGW